MWFLGRVPSETIACARQVDEAFDELIVELHGAGEETAHDVLVALEEALKEFEHYREPIKHHLTEMARLRN